MLLEQTGGMLSLGLPRLPQGVELASAIIMMAGVAVIWGGAILVVVVLLLRG